jgi:hypothetical protein
MNMRRTVVLLILFSGCLAAVVLTGRAQTAQQASGPAAPPRHASPSGMSQATLDDMLIRFPLPPGQEVYADIDGKRMHRAVVEEANIARRYRDQGHRKFWGRIIGTSADAENVEWMLAKFKSAGLTDVRSQPLDLAPQWFPQSWEVTLVGGGKTITLESAQPDYGTVKRTMVFVALDGHHNSGEGSAVGNQWIIQNRQKLFAKTALAINVEHPSTIQTQSRPRYYNANEIVWVTPTCHSSGMPVVLRGLSSRRSWPTRSNSSVRPWLCSRIRRRRRAI